MRIERATLTRFSLPLRAPLLAAYGTISERAGVLVELEGAEGARGFGEAMPIASFPGESLDEAEAALEGGVSALLLADSADCRHLSADTSQRLSAAPLACSALCSALAALAASEDETSLASWLAPPGFTPHSSIPVNALITEEAPDQIEREVAAAQAAGYVCFKLKVGALSLAADVERTAVLRSAAGPHAKLRLDANEAWSEASAIVAINSLSGFDLEYVEQPIPAREAAAREAATRLVAALGRIQAATGVAIAADEAASSAAAVQHLIETSACDVVVLKPALLGGPVACRALAIRAAEAGMRVVLTSFIDSAIGIAHALALAASLPGREMAHGLGTSVLLADDLAEPAQIVGGRIDASPAAGLGVEPDPVALERCARAPAREWTR